MGLYKQYFRVTQNARDKLFGKGQCKETVTPLQMLISDRGKFSHRRLAVILIGVFTLAIGIIFTSIPWLDYLILKNLKLWNGSISFQYWQKPGVIRLTKVYIFNVTNPDNFLKLGEKPRLQEIGPFVYREDMEKVNVRFHDNGTVSYQHKKILQFVPELSVNKEQRITVPNIPLLTLAMQSNTLGYFVQKTISLILNMGKFTPFVTVTADELVFGYEDQLVALAHKFYPKKKRPMSKMGLLINRNGTLDEVHNIYTGTTDMRNFGLLEKLNGIDKLPYWKDPPCNAITASEGSFFPPRDLTKSDLVYLYDKDICRILPFQYRGPVTKHGISADIYVPPDNIFETVSVNPKNKCFCPGNEFCPPKGLQNISPCQFDAPVYISFPHFYNADPKLSAPFDGLTPNKELHESFFIIQPKLGVPLEAKVRIQLNLKVDEAPYVTPVAKFPSMIYPIMWLEEGVDDLTPTIRRWIYLGTTFADVACPLVTYGFIFAGSCILIGVFVNGYKSLVFTKKTLEMGMKNLHRRGSSLISHTPHRLIIARGESHLLIDKLDDLDEV